MGIVQIDLSLHLFFDVPGKGKIRLPEIASDHPFPLIFDRLDLGPDLESIFRIQ
jgi:hypothetical protein